MERTLSHPPAPLFRALAAELHGFDGNRAIEGELRRFVHDTHPAAADLLAERVPFGKSGRDLDGSRHGFKR